MDRRKMLQAAGIGGLTTWTGSAMWYTRKDVDGTVMHFVPSFQEFLVNPVGNPGDFVSTLGYYEVNDGGAAQYRLEASENQKINKETDPDLFPVNSGIAARLIITGSVNYKIFGAKGDGQNDDGPAIHSAHQLANTRDLPVVNLSGRFRLGAMRNIPVETGVQWGQSVFYIDESQNTSEPVFHIRSRMDPVDIPASGSVGQAIIEQVRPGVVIIPELAGFENHLIHLYDEEDRIGFRAGNYNNRSRAREELFYVSQQGRILGDVAWEFKSTVTITAYPAEHSYLEVEGGTFFLSGDTPELKKTGYSHNGLLITRSRTRIKNQWVGIEPGQSDISMTARSGFYYCSLAYDIRLEDIRLNPREKDREGQDRDVPQGTYGIGGNRVLEFSMKDVTAEGTGIHWGVFGTNMMKNVSLSRCRINRFDVHFHLWNLTMEHCAIGLKGITITGGGRLSVMDTVVTSRRFINFRQDYGAKWDGDIDIRRCRLHPPFNQTVQVLSFQAKNFDYGYPIGMAHSIFIRDFLVDYTSVPDNDADCWLLQLSEFSVSDKGDRLFFPHAVHFQNIQVTGRERGVRIGRLTDVPGYETRKTGGYDGDMIQSNSHWVVDRVDLQEVNPGLGMENQYHLAAFTSASDQIAYSSHSPYISLTVTNCGALSVVLPGIKGSFLARDSTLHQLVLEEREEFGGEVVLENCHILPVGSRDDAPVIRLNAELGTGLTNCVIHLPVSGKESDAADLSLIGFLEINRKLSYRHINTRLSKHFRKYLAEQGITIHADFAAKLQLSAHE